MLKRKSIIRQWGFSYAILLLVPLITILINYSYNAKTIEKEIVQAHELILNNLKNNIDSLMAEEWEMFSTFYLNEKFNKVLNAKELNAEFRFDAYKLKNELSYYCSSNEKLACWMYLEDQDYIVCSGGANDSLNIYNAQKLSNSAIPEFEEWKRFLSGDYANEFLFYDGLYSGTAVKNLVYANSLQGEVGKVNVFVTISISAIKDMIEELSEEFFLTIYMNDSIQDAEERVLVLNSAESVYLPQGISVEDIKKERGNFETADYTGISILSDNGKVTYFLLIPQEIFWKEASYIRNVHLVSLFITVILGICLIVLLLKRNFNPVSKLLNAIGNESGDGNEFERIEIAYSMLRQENAVMKNRIETQEKQLVSSYLLSVLKGRITMLTEGEQQIGLGISLENNNFALIGFYIPLKIEAGMKYDELSFFIVDNIWTELMEGEVFYRIEDGRFLYYLFCIPGGNEEKWKQKGLKKADFLCTLLEEKFNLSLLGAISAVETDINQAKYMYQSVMEALEYKSIVGGSGVVATDELFEPDENNKFHACHVMLQRALEKGSIEEACKASSELFRNTVHMPFLALKLKVLEAFQIVVDTYNKCITDSVKRMQLLAWLEQLLNADNPEETKRQFEGVIVFACTKIDGQWEAENKGIVKKVKEYVEANYTDSNLNVSSIAEKMNKNSKYVSKVFKEETGEGILEYINLLRIRKAQEILLTKSISQEELSAMVGYASTRTFRRSFIKIVGTTPSEYLESN